MEKNQKPKRTNGFQKPLNKYQVFSWFIVIAQIALISSVILPIIRIEIQVPLIQIVSSLAIYPLSLVTIYYTIKATSINPTDNVQIQIDQNKGQVVGETILCSLCEILVSKRAKHCFLCNRCVDGFDHHCKWLNNCVGSRNYQEFIKLISALQIMQVSIFVTSLYSIVIFYSTDKLQQQISQQFSSKAQKFIIVCVWIQGILSFFISLANGYLIFLHLYLWKKGITTFELIMRQREKSKSKIFEEKSFEDIKISKTIEETSKTVHLSSIGIDLDVSFKSTSR